MQSYYYTRDHLGCIREMTNSAGAVQARYDYDPYGKRTKVSGALDMDFGYTGHYHHTPSGMNLTHYRAYSPTFGRWLSRDPLRNAEILEGTNLYAYVGNDPTNYVDPDGQGEIPAWIPFGGGGRICNDTKCVITVRSGGVWKELKPGECTSYLEDADGYWDINGGWHKVPNGNGTTNASNTANPGVGPTDIGLPTNDRPRAGGN